MAPPESHKLMGWNVFWQDAEGHSVILLQWLTWWVSRESSFGVCLWNGTCPWHAKVFYFPAMATVQEKRTCRNLDAVSFTDKNDKKDQTKHIKCSLKSCCFGRTWSKVSMEMHRRHSWASCSSNLGCHWDPFDSFRKCCSVTSMVDVTFFYNKFSSASSLQWNKLVPNRFSEMFKI